MKNNSFTIEEVYQQEADRLQKLNIIKNDIETIDEAASIILHLSEVIERLTADSKKLEEKNEELETDLLDAEQKIDELEEEIENLKEQLEDCSPRDYYEEIGMRECDF